MEKATTTQAESFKARVTREHRAAICLLVDSSASMQSQVTYEGRPLTQCEVAALSANSILKELLCKSKVSDEIRDYYDVMILVYCGNKIISVFGDESGNHFRSITEIAKIGRGDTIVSLEAVTPFNSDDEELRKSKFSIEPKGETPMYEALDFAYEILKEWVERPENRDSTPPIVTNLTDGHATDSTLEDIIEVSERIKSLATKDGNTLLVNLFINEDAESMIFPTEEELENCPNEFFRAMGRAASRVPAIFEPMVHHLRDENAADKSQSGYRAVGLGISVEDMIAMMNIGTLVTTK
ncbi:MAG: hypothetical protein SNH79_06725 [Rikenellaceae bacterium]